MFEKDDIFIRFIKCDNLHLGNIGIPDQEEIDRKLRDCDLSLFLFKAKAGEWTVHEFDVARALQKKKQHTIYVYTISVPESEKKQSLLDFQQRLIHEEFIWKECRGLDEVKFSFAMGILNNLGITLGNATPQAQAVEDSAEARFNQFEETEKRQASLREELHHDIEEMLAKFMGLRKPKPSRMIITEDCRIILPDYHNMEIVMAPLAKNTVFHIFKSSRRIAIQ